ncbi:Receptor L domain protein, partial [Trichostrongylus colubriformis]
MSENYECLVCDHQDFNIKTRSDITAFATQCKDPEVINLINAPVLEMCIRVEMSTIVELDLSHILSLSGKCDGPRLVIAQNLKLENIKFSRYFMKKSKPDTVVIRGNPKLRKSTIKRLKSAFNREAVDLQNFGEIVDNANLCIRDTQHLKTKFEGLVILQNETCEVVCQGGIVDHRYLATVDGCKTINGNLVFQNLHYSNDYQLDNLYSIKRIDGSLRIHNTYGLGHFNALENLKEVAVPPGESGPAIEIIENTGLTSLEFPHLSKIKSSDNVKIIIVKNPYLTMKKALVEKMYKMAHGKQHTKIEFTDSSTLADKFSDHALEAVILILILLIVLMALCIACLIIYPYYQDRRSRNKHGFPKPPWNIGKKSKEILAGWVKDIVAKNPLIWRCSDRDVIWSYKDTDGAHKDIEVLIANNDQFLTDHMLLLAENAKIGESDRFLQCERVKGMLEKEVIIFIGASEHPSGVLPHLPKAVNGEYTYKYLCSSYSFTLKKIKTMAPNTKEYTYDVSCVPKGKKPFRKTTKIIYNRWKNTEMPQEYDEILQLAMTYEPSKTLCASDRRKEVFSLIHLFHTFCLLLQEPINLVDALQLHTEKCNASMLDRSELLYVMAVIMEWAYQSRSV